MHFREIPFLRLLAPLCTGVILAEAAPGGDTAAWIIAALSSAFLTLLLFRKKYSADLLFGVTLMILIAAGGYLSCIFGKNRLSTYESTEQLFLIRMSEYPDKRAKSYSIRAEIEAAGKGSLSYGQRGSLLLYLMQDTLAPVWQPGDRLLISKN